MHLGHSLDSVGVGAEAEQTRQPHQAASNSVRAQPLASGSPNQEISRYRISLFCFYYNNNKYIDVKIWKVIVSSYLLIASLIVDRIGSLCSENFHFNI